ncbi:hypothetical protein BHQ19_10330 [Mycolicibacterium porcinum]|nr:hypothetical protein BHQ19_10330 [Mycolicibacterium porcinum]
MPYFCLDAGNVYRFNTQFVGKLFTQGDDTFDGGFGFSPIIFRVSTETVWIIVADDTVLAQYFIQCR